MKKSTNSFVHNKKLIVNNATARCFDKMQIGIILKNVWNLLLSKMQRFKILVQNFNSKIYKTKSLESNNKNTKNKLECSKII
jgi:hypothetical protein